MLKAVEGVRRGLLENILWAWGCSIKMERPWERSQVGAGEWGEKQRGQALGGSG